ncbi:Leucine-responsive regulatory protein [Thalassovita gelatinovora]|uniref:Leucine-responsive regulatory protein n=1 Tax=Thalassovita gelatinovora TaxID=53501 RepID=A0A0N7LVA2_THAGE|nr:Lrp/AsnC family transcriptional regulator [Thalassovita gelatinovora]QIZ80029.1 Lrp/AsnC family transcriptional regulator [Thalassovita gelatinovora]CUH65730.1 Leucine-responsive regulatory protein [Thalassovita gelatinovora]SER04326.1 transcriptional regulator, AsnC family [Thalassovita gelatinovora]
MDAKDLQILRELQNDGRLSNAELAERVALSPSPCLRRVRLLEERGVIEGYTAIVNQKAYGLPVTVFIQIRLDHHSTEAAQIFEHAIQTIDEIMDCHLMTGETDYMLRVVVSSLEEYEQFVRNRLHPIPNVASINTSFAYGVVKKNRALPR